MSFSIDNNNNYYKIRNNSNESQHKCVVYDIEKLIYVLLPVDYRGNLLKSINGKSIVILKLLGEQEYKTYILYYDNNMYKSYMLDDKPIREPLFKIYNINKDSLMFNNKGSELVLNRNIDYIYYNDIFRDVYSN